MIQAALNAWITEPKQPYNRSSAMRSALEAALGAKPTSDLINKLRDTATNRFHPPRKKYVEQEIEWKAAACIEELAGALKAVLPPEHFGEKPSDATRSARTTLEKWGLK